MPALPRLPGKDGNCLRCLLYALKGILVFTGRGTSSCSPESDWDHSGSQPLDPCSGLGAGGRREESAALQLGYPSSNPAASVRGNTSSEA